MDRPYPRIDGLPGVVLGRRRRSHGPPPPATDGTVRPDAVTGLNASTALAVERHRAGDPTQACCADSLRRRAGHARVRRGTPCPGRRPTASTSPRTRTSPSRRWQRRFVHDQHRRAAAMSTAHQTTCPRCRRATAGQRVLLVRAGLRTDGCGIVPGVAVTPAARRRGRSARRRRLSRVWRPPTSTAPRSPSTGRTTSTPTPCRTCGAARWAPRPPRTTGSRSTTTRRSRPRSTPRSSTRRRTRRPTAVSRGHVLLAGAGTRRRGQRPDLVRGADLHQVQPCGRACPRRSAASRCPAPRRSDGRPSPSPRRYTVETYRNNDQTFSAANRVFSATVRRSAYTPSLADPGGRTRRTCGGCAATTCPATPGRGRPAVVLLVGRGAEPAEPRRPASG